MFLSIESRNTVTNIALWIILVSFVIFLYTPVFTHAQITPKLNNVIVLNVNPTYPGPNEAITVSAESFSIDLNNTTISWFVNGVLEQQSIGTTSFQFTTGALGESTDIDVIANVTETSIESESITIRPTGADIIWQGDTFAHPLYKGKHIPSIGSAIYVEVVPHFYSSGKTKLGADTLSYTWRIDNKTLPNASGRGKNTINISQTKPVKSILVEVEIRSPDKLLLRKERLSIPIQPSELLIYENNPLLGILFNKAVGNIYSLVEKETKFIAYPFFMSLINRNDSHVNYSWRLNNSPITLGEDRGSIVVSRAIEDVGEANISVLVQNTRNIFQKSESNFLIEFGKNTSSIFGF